MADSTPNEFGVVRSPAAHRYAGGVASPDKPKTKISGARRAALEGGRFTPKGTVPKAKGPAGDKESREGSKPNAGASDSKIPAYANTGRYTPPSPHETAEGGRQTKPWVVPALAFFLILGMLLIINYYVGVLPGGRSGYYLLGGLVSITGGFAVATQLN